LRLENGVRWSCFARRASGDFMVIEMTRIRCLQLLALLLLVPGLPALAQGKDAVARPVTIYGANPEHLWNRLHSALFVRTASDKKSHGQDELDPLLSHLTRSG
jgi:hypothetical protein